MPVHAAQHALACDARALNSVTTPRLTRTRDATMRRLATRCLLRRSSRNSPSASISTTFSRVRRSWRAHHHARSALRTLVRVPLTLVARTRARRQDRRAARHAWYERACASCAQTTTATLLLLPSHDTLPPADAASRAAALDAGAFTPGCTEVREHSSSFWHHNGIASARAPSHAQCPCSVAHECNALLRTPYWACSAADALRVRRRCCVCRRTCPVTSTASRKSRRRVGRW